MASSASTAAALVESVGGSWRTKVPQNGRNWSPPPARSAKPTNVADPSRRVGPSASAEGHARDTPGPSMPVCASSSRRPLSKAKRRRAGCLSFGARRTSPRSSFRATPEHRVKGSGLLARARVRSRAGRRLLRLAPARRRHLQYIVGPATGPACSAPSSWPGLLSRTVEQLWRPAPRCQAGGSTSKPSRAKSRSSATATETSRRRISSKLTWSTREERRRSARR